MRSTWRPGLTAGCAGTGPCRRRRGVRGGGRGVGRGPDLGRRLAAPARRISSWIGGPSMNGRVFRVLAPLGWLAVVGAALLLLLIAGAGPRPTLGPAAPPGALKDAAPTRPRRSHGPRAGGFHAAARTAFSPSHPGRGGRPPRPKPRARTADHSDTPLDPARAQRLRIDRIVPPRAPSAAAPPRLRSCLKRRCTCDLAAKGPRRRTWRRPMCSAAARSWLATRRGGWQSSSAAERALIDAWAAGRSSPRAVFPSSPGLCSSACLEVLRHEAEHDEKE